MGNCSSISKAELFYFKVYESKNPDIKPGYCKQYECYCGCTKWEYDDSAVIKKYCKGAPAIVGLPLPHTHKWIEVI